MNNGTIKLIDGSIRNFVVEHYEPPRDNRKPIVCSTGEVYYTATRDPNSNYIKIKLLDGPDIHDQDIESVQFTYNGNTFTGTDLVDLVDLSNQSSSPGHISVYESITLTGHFNQIYKNNIGRLY